MTTGPRPWIRRYPALTISALVFGLLAIWLTWEVFRAVTAKPGQVGAYAKQVEEIVAKRQQHLASPDCWDDLLKAVRLVSDAQRDALAKTGTPNAASPLPDAPADWPEGVDWPPDPSYIGTDKSDERIVQYVKLVDAQLRTTGADKALTALLTPRIAIRPIPPTRMIDILLPELGQCRVTARINHGRMLIALDAGDRPAFLQAMEQTLAIARILSAQATLIDHLVATAMCAMVLGDIRYLIVEGRLDRELLTQVSALLDRQLPLVPLSESLKCERLFAMDTIEWTHSQDGRLMPSAAIAAHNEYKNGGQGDVPALAGFENLLSIVLPSKKESQDAIDQFYTLVDQQLALPAHARTRPSPSEKFADDLSSRFIVVKLMIPAISKTLVTESTFFNDVAATRTMIVLELFRAQNNTYPKSLSELVPAFLTAVPQDSFSPRALTYVLKDPSSPRPADAYLLYSVGGDFKDDGGKIPENANNRGSGGDPGSDLVYNVPRPSSKPPQDGK